MKGIVVVSYELWSSARSSTSFSYVNQCKSQRHGALFNIIVKYLYKTLL